MVRLRGATCVTGRGRAASGWPRTWCPTTWASTPRWVTDHPDYFVQRADPPYPAYSWTGPNLSTDERVGIYLEDHYTDASDAAVVFKRVDRWSGTTRYIYHGNDGTSFPWNDTAQLDYLRADVREAVIRTIIEVARRFPVIRFDAAMVLARKHVQRFGTRCRAAAAPARYVREVFGAQETRRFVLGFTLCGSLMRVWEFDRLGGIASEQFDINKKDWWATVCDDHPRISADERGDAWV